MALLMIGVATLASAADVTLVDLQPARRSESAAASATTLTLTSLNPAVNAWFLFTVEEGGKPPQAYHLELADPRRQHIRLDPKQPGQIVMEARGSATRCVLWPGDELPRARRSMLPYAPLCDGQLHLRNAVAGNRTALEATTQFLRDHVWGGEQIVGFVRREVYADAFVERGAPASAPAATSPRGAPPPARTRPGKTPQAVSVESLGLDIGTRHVLTGQWYGAANLDGVYVSVAQPGTLANAADSVEAQALAYLVAFDLSRFELGFALGTEHPRLGWSARIRDDQLDARLAGPDGIADAKPLVRNGMLNPALQARAVATFTGGFKREHGAFRHGALATVNHGSHYGFIEQGVVFSRLVPGLSTLYATHDGSVDIKTWTAVDDRRLGEIRHARQNGVPLVERNASGPGSHAGTLVDQWGPGNWSGSADERLRTLRASACLIEEDGHRFLVYAYFSAATPRTMSDVLQGYGCRDAMHLDMNALEHTYLALYVRNGSQLSVEHLIKGMSVLDKQVRGTLLPRFLGVADDRDFFYLVRKEESP